MVNPFHPPIIRFCCATLSAALVAAAVAASTRADETQAYESAVASLAAGCLHCNVSGTFLGP
jgi:hypothetical protein